LPRLIILGTSFAIPDQQHENTHFAVVGEDRFLLIDTGSNPTVRLTQAGLDLLKLSDLLLTHFHPDHVSGTPSLLMNSWLKGRKNLLDIYGLEDTLKRVEKNMDLYEWASWPNFFPTRFNNIPHEERSPVLAAKDFSVFVSPVRHMIPVIGVRIESHRTGQVIVYSGDTEPSEEVIRLSAGADILIHEASGAGFGHSSAAQAGEVARQAGVNRLYLIHYPTGGFDPNPLVDQASQTFSGPVSLAQDLMEIDF